MHIHAIWIGFDRFALVLITCYVCCSSDILMNLVCISWILMQWIIVMWFEHILFDFGHTGNRTGKTRKTSKTANDQEWRLRDQTCETSKPSICNNELPLLLRLRKILSCMYVWFELILMYLYWFWLIAIWFCVIQWIWWILMEFHWFW